ncbi:hypothetical protein [Tautonia plasticadhaerens]|uniref:DUF4058 domain-containing protein n=1 Tax=Tautonia plasticadhaerens TaxID=2527974 RepID=A0A518HFN9_9BACT|nr:hypothetical protein [Tautonia plasticadhaerens]QDV39657.1 hypothetical protein ElP_76290 [Tautonia plasticadhaerens]
MARAEAASGFVAAPHVHLGSSIEVDVGTFERAEEGPPGWRSDVGEGGVATAVWAPPKPTLGVATDLPGADEYEVLVHDTRRGRRLVAAVELVSPSNTDRPEHRREFATKCEAMLRQGVCVAIVDVVTTRSANLYGELLSRLGMADPSLGDEPTPTYASSCRWSRGGGEQRLEAWAYPMGPGLPLPTLPLWLAPGLAVPLELEGSYEETCRVLRIP